MVITVTAQSVKQLTLVAILVAVALAGLVSMAGLASATVNNYLYTSATYGDKVYVADADNLSVIGNFSGMGQITGMKASPDNKWVVVVNESKSQLKYFLAFLNTSSGEIERAIESKYVYDLAFSGDSSRLYVLTTEGVQIYNSASGLKSGAIDLRYPIDDEKLIAVSPDDNRVYVVTGRLEGSSVTYNDNNITVYDAHSHDYLKVLRFNTTVNALAVSPDGSTIYAATTVYQPGNNFKSTNRLVYVINAVDLSVIRYIGVGQNPGDIRFSIDGKKAYTSNEDDGSVSIIDTINLNVIKTVTVPVQPRGIAVGPDGKKIYITGGGSDINIIDTATDASTTSGISGAGAIGFMAPVRVSSGFWIMPGLITGTLNPGLLNLSTPTPTAAPTATPVPTAEPTGAPATGTPAPTAEPSATPAAGATATPAPGSPSSIFLVPLGAGIALLLLAATGRHKR